MRLCSCGKNLIRGAEVEIQATSSVATRLGTGILCNLLHEGADRNTLKNSRTDRVFDWSRVHRIVIMENELPGEDAREWDCDVHDWRLGQKLSGLCGLILLCLQLTSWSSHCITSSACHIGRILQDFQIEILSHQLALARSAIQVVSTEEL